MATRLSLLELTISQRQTRSGRTLTIRIKHNRSTVYGILYTFHNILSTVKYCNTHRKNSIPSAKKKKKKKQKKKQQQQQTNKKKIKKQKQKTTATKKNNNNMTLCFNLTEKNHNVTVFKRSFSRKPVMLQLVFLFMALIRYGNVNRIIKHGRKKTGKVHLRCFYFYLLC